MRRCIALLLLSVACSDESLDPLEQQPTATAPEPPDAGPEGGAPPVGPRVRDVYLRNPLGAPFDNLMADGDFELSIVPEGNSGQHGWVAFSQSGDGSILAETGGLCRSGLRCGLVKSGLALYGRGTAAADQVPHRGSIWMKRLAESGSPPPPDGPCHFAEAYVLECNTFESEHALAPAEAPDEQGWCQFSGEVDKASVALCMYVLIGDDDVIVDNATLLAAPDLDASPIPPAIAPPARRERMLRVRDMIRKRTRFGNPSPPAPASARAFAPGSGPD